MRTREGHRACYEEAIQWGMKEKGQVEDCDGRQGQQPMGERG